MPPSPLRTGFRADIQALRALAIVLVLGYHAELGLPGGYVGLDVFFVVSGFLITGLLLARQEQHGRVPFADFYARRAWRLLPAAAVVLVATAVGSWIVLDPLTAREVTADAGWAGAYAANVRFMLLDLDYFGAARDASPVLHFWSLSVEEQFYLVWPVALATAALLGRRRGRRRQALALVIGVLSLASFTHALLLTGDAAGIAYYSPLTRAWEFGAGGIAALAVRSWPTGWRVPPRWLAGIGLLGVVVPAATYTAATGVPGLPAVPVVLGTVLLLLPGSFVDNEPFRALTTARPLQWVGTVSYSLYLWHWPLLVWLGSLRPGAGIWLRIGAIVVAAGLAGVTHRLVEDPLRRRGPAAVPDRQSVVGGLATSVLVAAVAALAVATVPPVRGAGAATDLESVASQGALTEALEQAATAPAPVPANLQPPLDSARTLPRIYEDGCHNEGWRVDLAVTCRYGPTGRAPVVLLGDSLAAHWFPAMQAAAEAAGRPLVSLTKGACPAWDLPVYRPGMSGPFEECAEVRAATFDRLVDEIQPAVLVLGSAFPYLPLPGTKTLDPAEDALPDEPEARYLTAMGATLVDLRDRLPDTRIVVLGPQPQGPRGAECVAEALDDPAVCTIPVDEAVAPDFVAAHRETSLEAGADRWLDVRELQCTPDLCPSVVRGRLVSYDGAHLTAEYSRLLGPVIGDLLAEELTRGR